MTRKLTKKDLADIFKNAVKDLKGPDKTVAFSNEVKAKFPHRDPSDVLKGGMYYTKLLGLKAADGGEIKALTDDIMYTGADGQGGYINAPRETMAEIVRIMEEQSVVARLADFRTQTSDGVRVVTDTSALTVTYTDEAVAKTVTKPTLTKVDLDLKKPALQIVISDEEIQGSLVDIVSYLDTKCGEAFGQDLDYQFLGRDVASPYVSIPYNVLVNEVDLASADADGLTYAKFVEASCSIVSQAAAGARWFMHRTVLGDCLSIVDGVGRPIFQQDPTGAAFGTILGFPVELVEKMPVKTGYGTGVVPVLFGNLKYLRIGVKHGLQIKVSGDVTVTLDGNLVSCWENNLTALRAEARRSGALTIPSAFARFEMP